MATPNRQKLVQEILKVGKDCRYFLRKYAKIQHTTRGLVPFETYDFQDQTIDCLIEHRLNIVVKARQLGLSTVVAGFATWLALFHKQQNILVIATKRATAINFVKKVRTIIRNLPNWLILAQIVSDNKQEIEFSHGSSIKAIPTSEDAGRSEANSLLVIDEAAWIKNFDDLWTGLVPTISTGGKCVLLSTPNGVGNQFHKLYTDAEQNLNNFNALSFPWDVHPEHDEAWFNEETKGLGQRKINQEYLCDFVASGDTFLSINDIDWVRQSITPPIERLGVDKSIWVWEKPNMSHQYVISADVARGDAADYSAFHVIDVDAGDVVAEYKSRIPPDEFGELLAEIGVRYNTALLVVEKNSFGFATLVKLRDIGYPRVYKPGSKDVYIAQYSPIGDNVGAMGFDTNVRTRIRVLTKLEEVLRNKLIKVHSARLYDELKTFVWTGTKAQAMKGRNDDLIMSLAIGLWLFDVEEGYSSNDRTYNDNMLAAMGVDQQNGDNIPGLSKDISSKWNPYLPQMTRLQPVQAPDDTTVISKDPRFNYGDFSWILD